MPLEERDLSYLIDMAHACRDIMEFVSGVTYEQFENEKMRKLATERQLEVLGEAANHVSKVTQERFENIEWAKIIGLRNKLAHDYGEILAQRVWNIVQNNVSALYRQLIAIEELKRWIQ